MSQTRGLGRGRVVASSINVDWIVQALQLPKVGQTAAGTGVTRRHGGKGANQAVAARAGADVVAVGAVGDDGIADEELAALADAGVDATRMERIAGATTGFAMITVDRVFNGALCVRLSAGDTLHAATMQAVACATESTRFAGLARPRRHDVLLSRIPVAHPAGAVLRNERVIGLGSSADFVHWPMGRPAA